MGRKLRILDFIAVCTQKQRFIVRVETMGITVNNYNRVLITPGKIFVWCTRGVINAALNCWKSSAVLWVERKCRALILTLLIGISTGFPKTN